MGQPLQCGGCLGCTQTQSCTVRRASRAPLRLVAEHARRAASCALARHTLFSQGDVRQDRRLLPYFSIFETRAMRCPLKQTFFSMFSAFFDHLFSLFSCRCSKLQRYYAPASPAVLREIFLEARVDRRRLATLLHSSRLFNDVFGLGSEQLEAFFAKGRLPASRT